MKNCCSFLAAFVALSFFIGISSSSAPAADEPAHVEKIVSSPDQKISLVFSLTDGTPTYAVNFKKRPVILSSALGFELKDGSMKSGFTLLDAGKSSKDETWTQPWGEQKAVRDHYNELAVTLQQAGEPGRKLRIIFRVFDDAIAFRYEWPKQAALTNFDIMDELTEFVLSSDPDRLVAAGLSSAGFRTALCQNPVERAFAADAS